MEIRTVAGSVVWYTEDGSSPTTGRGRLLLESVARVSMYRPGVVRAVALRDGAVESLAAAGPYIAVLPPSLVAAKFLSTVGLWTFAADAARRGPGGAVWFADEAGGLGNATAALSGTAAWTADGADGVGFGPGGLVVDPAAMRGLYVTRDVGAPGGLLLAGKLPARRLSLEVRTRGGPERRAPECLHAKGGQEGSPRGGATTGAGGATTGGSRSRERRARSQPQCLDARSQPQCRRRAAQAGRGIAGGPVHRVERCWRVHQ